MHCTDFLLCSLITKIVLPCFTTKKPYLTQKYDPEQRSTESIQDRGSWDHIGYHPLLVERRGKVKLYMHGTFSFIEEKNSLIATIQECNDELLVDFSTNLGCISAVPPPDFPPGES
jgi:hypothetical protein